MPKFEDAMQRLEPQERPTNKEEMHVFASKNRIMGPKCETIQTNEYIENLLIACEKV